MSQNDDQMNVAFSDFFRVRRKTVERYGAFDISLVGDLPLFVDPFLLFNSRKRKYRLLHAQMIDYLRFLRDKSANQQLDPGLIRAWYVFPEVRQNWLGFSASGNHGRGLGPKFAQALHANLGKLFMSFGEERITKGSHLEKLCLISDGVGRDNISDFTNNLIRHFLLDYTEKFAQRFIDPSFRRKFRINKVRFNYDTESWESNVYDLPCFRGEYIILTPHDILTKDETWINKADLVHDFHNIPDAIPDVQLRAQINNYFKKVLPRRPKAEDERNAKLKTIWEFPELIDYFIKYKEEHGSEAERISAARVAFSDFLYLQQFKQLPGLLKQTTDFYKVAGLSYEEAHQRVLFFKDVIENKGGHRIFYVSAKPIEREADLHILYRMTWFASESDVTREANDGRGPVDFKISTGAKDKALVEFKLANNPQLKRNLQNQAEIYQKASDAKRTIKVIVFFTAGEKKHVDNVLIQLKLTNSPDVILVDARRDNKPSGSKA